MQNGVEVHHVLQHIRIRIQEISHARKVLDSQAGVVFSMARHGSEFSGQADT